MRVALGTPNDIQQGRDIHPIFERMASSRGAELQASPSPADPLESRLRPETLLELGSLYKGATAGIADFVTEQALAVAKMCVENDDRGALHPRLIDLLNQTELARRWIATQHDIPPPSPQVEARRKKEWSAQAESYIIQARSFALRQALVPGYPATNFTEIYDRSTGVTSTVGVGAASLATQGPALLHARVERRASNYDLGRLKALLSAIKRERKPDWIAPGTPAQALYNKASSLFASLVSDIWRLERSDEARRPAADAVTSIAEQAQGLIEQVDRARDYGHLSGLVRQLDDVCRRLTALVNVSDS